MVGGGNIGDRIGLLLLYSCTVCKTESWMAELVMNKFEMTMVLLEK